MLQYIEVSVALQLIVVPKTPKIPDPITPRFDVFPIIIYIYYNENEKKM